MDKNINNDAEINFEAQYTTPRQVLLNYTNAMQKLRLLAEQRYHVRQFHFDNFVLSQYFQQCSSKNSTTTNLTSSTTSSSSKSNGSLLTSLLKIELLKHLRDRRRQIICWLSYLMFALLGFLVYRQDAINSERSVQYLVYPSMRIWRRLTLPVIKRFPHLTEYHDESCLMGNPFFEIDLNCAPCANVDSVIDLDVAAAAVADDDNDDEKNPIAAKFVPFIFKINQSNIQMHDFYKIYSKNQEIFRRDAYRVQSTYRNVTNLDDLFKQFNYSNDDDGKQKETHNIWRCNRMLPARLLRPLLARPSSRLPNTGIALERFIAFDTPHAPTYTLPQTECDNVYIQQLHGTRFIILRPTSACRHLCRTLSMRLPQSFVLSYNWWYWKPISAPDPVAETSSISLIGSYC